jgi:tetratricopeptide (TPR) repeat protein
MMDKVLEIVPNHPDSIAYKAIILQRMGNLQEAGKLLAGVDEKTTSPSAFLAKTYQLLFERYADEVIRLLQSRLAESHALSDHEKLNYQERLADAQEYAGDMAGARATARELLAPLETLSKGASGNPNVAVSLSQIHAVLGEKEAAIREAERAVALVPSAKDAVEGPTYEENLARVEGMLGDKDRAIARLQHLSEIPYRYSVTPALLRLDPQWDPLRSDPRFQKLCEEKK